MDKPAITVVLSTLGNIFQLLGKKKPWSGHSCGITKVEYESFTKVVIDEHKYNPWFTEESVRYMLLSLGNELTASKIQKWLQPYSNIPTSCKKKIGIITAGNIPMVGFFDMLCCMVVGHYGLIKLSHDDYRLLPAIINVFKNIAPDLCATIDFVEKLHNTDAIIATGSNNSSRYFKHYFGQNPYIIRKSRHGIAILSGKETTDKLCLLGKDIFTYMGHGCRNVSKLYVPVGWEPNSFFESIFSFKYVIDHNKYYNNYTYNKTIYLLNSIDFLDNGFLLLKKDTAIGSPIGVVFYEEYENPSELQKQLQQEEEKIQCIVSKNNIPFGKAQEPALWDYADGVDTLRFLTRLT